MIPEKKETIRYYKDVKVGLSFRSPNPADWDKFIIPKLKVVRYDLGLGIYETGDILYDRLVTRLYWDQLMLEVKLAALDYMKTWKEEFKSLLLHDIAIISVGDEIY